MGKGGLTLYCITLTTFPRPGIRRERQQRQLPPHVCKHRDITHCDKRPANIYGPTYKVALENSYRHDCLLGAIL